MPPDRPVRARLRAHPTAGDALLAAALVLIWLLFALLGTIPDGWSEPAAVLASVLGVVPTVLRRLTPRTAVALQCAALVLPALLGVERGAESLSVLVVAYTSASMLPLRQAVVSAVALAASVTALLLLHRQEFGADEWVSEALVLLVCFFLGRTVLNRRAYTVALEERARAAEASREAAAREAVLDERRRIARELHDVVAHHVSVMGVLAAGARRALPRDPAAVDGVLATIEETGRATLREMRRLLDVLRTDGEPGDPPVHPQPGVEGLAALLTQVREAGLPVRLRVEGEPRPLEPGVDLTVYRVVQEGLTNTLKHGGPASAEVALRFRPGEVQVEVSDDGRGPRPDPPRTATGHGLVGMRERVVLYGGALHTGPRPDGGYVVRASIPLESALEATG